jgi:hypothetical protein
MPDILPEGVSSCRLSLRHSLLHRTSLLAIPAINTCCWVGLWVRTGNCWVVLVTNCYRLPFLLQGLFDAIPADEFRADISSTELRAAGR